MKLMTFFHVSIKNMACSIKFLTEKMEEIKTTCDIFLGKDLSYEENFLNSVIEKIGKEIKDCEVSFYLHRKNMSICCETLTMTETIARKLQLKIVDRLIDEHFFQTNGLRQLGWSAHYRPDRRSLNYYTEDKKELLRKTEVTEFYWFNNSPNRAFKQQLVTKTKVCNCMYCRFFMS